MLLAAAPLSAAAAWSGTDEEFVHMVESNNWEYFRYNQGGANHQFRGAGQHDEQYSYDPNATCAGDGFGIAALVVGAWRGWTTDEYAYTNILALLQAYDTSLARDGNEFFNHFYNFDTGVPQAEYSAIDSSWFLCGAVLAAQYFKGTEVESVANRIYNRFKYGSVGPFWGMYFEYTIINILGSGSPTNGWSAATAQSSWESCTLAAKDFMQGPLFWYQWPQAFVDFRFRTDSLGSNHFNIAVEAYLRQRQKCIDLRNASPANYPTFGTNAWGLTSGMASLGYLELRPFAGYCTANPNYGGPSIYCGGGATNDVSTDEEACDSGTLTPICLPACMTHVPYETRLAMKYLYDTFDNASNNIYDRYSFKNALNTGVSKAGYPFQWDDNASMDYGCNAVVLENFRSGMPWKYFMSHPYIVQGMANCGFSTPSIAYHDDWNDGADPNVWTGSTTYANSDGSNPTCTYDSITWYNDWVNTYARKLVANGSGDVVRFELKETDQSKEDLLSFWLRGAGGGESFDVGLRDAEGHETLVNIADYADGGTVSTNWQRVRVPLKRFAVSSDPNDDVRILFLGDFTVRFRASGTIWVDDLAFVDDDLAPPPPAFGAACIDGRVSLRWGYSADDDVVGYHLWRRPDSGSGFSRLNASLLSAKHDEVDVTVESQWGEDFYYAAQCLDRHGNAGPFSAAENEQRVWIGRARDLDWGDGQNPNTFGGSSDGTWGGSWRGIWFERQYGWDGKTNWIRHMAGDTDNGCYIGLNGGDVSPYEALTFRLKQEWGANTFLVGLRSTNGVERKVPVTRYTTVTDSWASVTIPLIDFSGVDFARMDNLSFEFTTAGNIYVDDIRFARLERELDLGLVFEGEACGGHAGGETNDFKWGASQAYCLGNAWATNANDDAWFAVNVADELNGAYLDVRYACDVSGGRNLQALVNSEARTNFPVQYTGGWGDESWHFKDDPVWLGRITNASFLLKLLATNAGAAVNLDRVILRSGGRWFREAEDCDAQSGSGGADYKPGASGGEVLGNSWGGGSGDFAAYSNVVFAAPLAEAWLQARYGQSWGDGRLIRVLLDGTNMGSLAFANTDGWLDRWSDGGIAELPLGPVGGGTHVLRLEAVGDDEDVNVDWLKIADGPEAFNGYDTDGDGIPDRQEPLFGTSTNLADSDADGLGDQFELSRLGGVLTSPTNADTDADGQHDGEEYVAGTDGSDSNSVFKFVPAAAAIQPGGNILVRWAGAPGRNYDVGYRNTGPANPVIFTSITNPAAIVFSNTVVSYLDDGAGTGFPPGHTSAVQRTYRVRAYAP